MAKLKAPLMSLGASGQLGKTLVFLGWKGINVVREYVVPANPDTTRQQTQRGYVTAAVAKIHASQALAVNPLDSDDQVAYSALASAKGKIMTWFNQAVKLWIDVKVAGKIPVIYCNCRFPDLDVTTFNARFDIEEESLNALLAGTFYFGTSKTNLIHSEAAGVTLGNFVDIANVDLSAFLTAGKKYYCQFRPDAGDPCVGADSGIYYFVAE